MAELTDNLLREISEAVAEENRPAVKIYQEVQNIGALMMFTRTMTKAQVVGMCAGLVKLYQMLKEQ